MSEMLDRVTQAIGTYFFRMWASATSYAVMKGEAWDGPPVEAGLTMSEARDLAFRLNAEAAIEAMREPSEAMIKAGARAVDYNSPD